MQEKEYKKIRKYLSNKNEVNEFRSQENQIQNYNSNYNNQNENNYNNFNNYNDFENYSNPIQKNNDYEVHNYKRILANDQNKLINQLNNLKVKNKLIFFKELIFFLFFLKY